MPDFPTYYGSPLPKVLNPLNPYHYWLVLTWLYFCPSHLKHYLYQADPELYRASGLSSVKRSLLTPVYRNLYFIAVGLVVFLSASILLAVTVGSNNSPNLAGIATILGVGLIVAALMLFVLQVWLGIIGVLAMLTLGIAVCVGVIAFVSNIGERWGGGIYLIVLGIGTGITFNSMFALLSPVSGVVLGTFIGILAIGGLLTLYPPPPGSADAFIAFTIVILAGSRGLFHLFELPLVWWVKITQRDPFRQLARHPIIWDELNGWPFPGVVQQLRTCLERNLEHGLQIALAIAMNPVQRWVYQRAVFKVLLNALQPLRLLDEIEHSPLLTGYLQVPVTGPQARRWLAAREVFLGEIGQQYVDATGGDRATTEKLTWALTRRQRNLAPAPVAQLAAMLYALVHDEAILETQDVRAIQLAERFAANYESVRVLPQGEETAQTFAALDRLLRYETIADLAEAGGQLTWLARLSDEPLRPALLEALKALADVSQDIATFQRLTNVGQKATALNRAAGALTALAEYTQANILPPERILLKRAVQLWQTLIAAEQGKLGEAALRDMSPAMRHHAGLDVDRQSTVWQRPLSAIKNPYIVGNPVKPPLFVGRVDIFNRIGEVWSAKDHPDSIILYGHRRMGKSSILRNLDQAVRSGGVIVYIDLAGETSFIESTADLLLGLANKLTMAVRRAYPNVALTAPDGSAYTSASKAQLQFDQLVEQVRDVGAGATVIFALDEFEAIDRAVASRKIGADIYQFLRTKTQDPLFTFVLGGLHTLDEMSRDYQQPFYGSYANIRVSYLAPADARRLITNPTPDFDLNYEPVAVERIISETGGQPYLVQQLCRDALDHLNAELFDEQRQREVLITVSDVEAVLDREFFTRGTVYFDGVWSQTTNADQQAVLRVLARRAESWTFDEVRAATSLAPEAAREALRWARHHDIVRSSTDGASDWQYCVPLMRRWVSEKQ